MLKVVSSTSNEFNPLWIAGLELDPVQPPSLTRNIERRTNPIDRRIFAAIINGEVAAFLQVALTQGTVDNVDKLWGDVVYPQHNTAIFYSVFKSNEADSYAGLGQELIIEAAKILSQSQAGLVRYVTMSPIPSMVRKFKTKPTTEEVWDFVQKKSDPVARFHINNGAKLLSVWENADNSELRQQQSWGYMASYDYSSAI